ncbi:MAG: hypothetical protein ACLQT6_07575 [Desulfomonilaceae bacterium]
MIYEFSSFTVPKMAQEKILTKHPSRARNVSFNNAASCSAKREIEGTKIKQQRTSEELRRLKEKQEAF